MKTFSILVNALDSTNKTHQKIDAIRNFLSDASDQDKLWFLALFTGKRPKRSVATGLLKQWCIEQIQIPEWLFAECYAAVGDLGETIALVLPAPQYVSTMSLSEWMGEIIHIKDASEEEKKRFVWKAWNSLSNTECFIFNKLLGGSFRLGVSAKSLINAVAQHYQLEPNAVTHSIMGDWQIDKVQFDDLIEGRYTNTQLSKPYPFCLAYPLEKGPEQLGIIEEWQVEYKWDGIRAQIVKRGEDLFIWSRGEELITAQFPEIEIALKKWENNFVIDGELLAYKNAEVLNFSALQKRLNRKSFPKKLLEEIPVVFFAYDLMEFEGTDWRSRTLEERRAQLDKLWAKGDQSIIHLSPIISVDNWALLAEIRSGARGLNSEGLMLKDKKAPYHTGRKKGDWWKWKIDPLTIDAVLLYAQKGSGRRSGYYTDYTFGVRQGDQLVTIAKAYSGLTDKEIQEVSRFVNKNAIEKFGPVRTVKPELVFEIAFEGIGFSSRHKSGVALRFPRIVRWRRDKTVADIDDIATIKLMIH